MSRYPVILGPTASGKTRLAVVLAGSIGGEIVSADSRQIYRDMDLGTGKDLDDYGSIAYHLIDIAPAGYRYNLFEYLRDTRQAMADIRERGKVPVVCGGTGMYLEALAKGTVMPQVPRNEELRRKMEGVSHAELAEILASRKTLHNTTDIDTRQRALRALEIQEYYSAHPEEAAGVTPGKPDSDAVLIGIDIDRETRRNRITRRLDARLARGMIDEVRSLIDSGIDPEDLIYYGLEYKFLTLHITGQLSFEEMRSQLEIAIHQFAKRQMTWFRGMERRGFTINWLPFDMPADEFIDRCRSLLGL